MTTKPSKNREFKLVYICFLFTQSLYQAWFIWFMVYIVWENLTQFFWMFVVFLLTWATFLVNSFMLLSEQKKNCYWNCCPRPFNELVSQIERHPNSCRYPLINYLFHLLGNRLTVLPPQLGQLDFLSSRKILKLDNNPWVPPIEDQLILGETITRYMKELSECSKTSLKRIL